MQDTGFSRVQGTGYRVLIGIQIFNRYNSRLQLNSINFNFIQEAMVHHHDPFKIQPHIVDLTLGRQLDKVIFLLLLPSSTEYRVQSTGYRVQGKKYRVQNTGY